MSIFNRSQSMESGVTNDTTTTTLSPSHHKSPFQRSISSVSPRKLSKDKPKKKHSMSRVGTFKKGLTGKSSPATANRQRADSEMASVGSSSDNDVYEGADGVSVPTEVSIELFTGSNFPSGNGPVLFKAKNKTKVKAVSSEPEGPEGKTRVTWNTLCKVETDGKSEVEVHIVRGKKEIDQLRIPLKNLKENKVKKTWRLDGDSKIVCSIWISAVRYISLEKARSKKLVHRNQDDTKYEVSDDDEIEDPVDGNVTRNEMLDNAFENAIRYVQSRA